MSMDNFGSIQLHHETVAQAASELGQAGKMMDDALWEVEQKLNSLTESGSFQGAAADAFTEFKRAVTTNAAQMNQDIIAAGGKLTNMHHIMTEADQGARKQFG
ncbi:WXG100 family type VII secretion target [Kitasatospora sp. NPDC004799]|uniref:WXG100 family type VII secretion target n=1 Tax=Kitasatospora sp. NPDC004799 TaxID=3154460 RepID=UPI0033B049EA